VSETSSSYECFFIFFAFILTLTMSDLGEGGPIVKVEMRVNEVIQFESSVGVFY